MAISRNRVRSCSAVPAINVTPLIDVLLVLLIIFMVIQPQKEAKLPVKAPEPATPELPSPETLMLTVSTDMQLELNSKRIDVSELLPFLSDLMEQRPVDSRTLIIRAPAKVGYGSIAMLIDLAKGSGVVTIGLVEDAT